MTADSSDRTIVVRFREPVEGVDPGTGDRFVSDRHTVICAEARQTHEWTWFCSAAGAEAARWPTDLMQSVRWPSDLVDHETRIEVQEQSPPAPLRTRPAVWAADEVGDIEPADRSSYDCVPVVDWLDVATAEEHRAEAADWDDVSEELITMGYQGSRAVLWNAMRDNARSGTQCPICGDRVIDSLVHPCRG